MDTKTKALLKAILELPETQRQLLLAELLKYNSINLNEQRTFSESLNRSLGPLYGDRCAVCGK